MTRQVTIRDVAKSAGVGVGTVSRVLNHSPSVKESTRQRVEEAIRSLNYSPNPAARRLSLGKTFTIGVIVPFFTTPSVTERLRGIESVVSKSRYDLVLFNVETMAQRDSCFRDVPRPDRADGLLIITLLLDDLDAERIALSGVPTVLIDSIHPHFSWVIVDNVEGGYQATKHLIDLGHRKIGFISDVPGNPFNFTPTQDRHQGYMDALAQADISFRPDYYRLGEINPEAARASAHEMLGLADPPTAIFAYSDTQAIGVLEAAQERGIAVPDQLSVIGFDDIEAAGYLGLSTIRQSLFQSGVIGTQLLLDSMANSETETRQTVLSTELVLRRTTAPPANVCT